MIGFEEAQNSVEQLTSVLPGAGTVGTTRSLARFYEWVLEGNWLEDASDRLSDRCPVLVDLTGTDDD